MKTKVVIFHAECTDGLGAVLAAKKTFGQDAVYIAAKPQWDPFILGESQYTNNDVYLLDYSFKRPILEKLISVAKTVTVVDHHKTAEADLKGLPNCYFDMNHSGAVLAWKFFHPELPVPELMKHIESRDLWKFDLPYSPEISTAIQSYGHNMDDPHWQDMIDNWRDWYPRLIQEGIAINRFRRAMISVVSKTVEMVNIEDQEVCAVNAQFLASEIGAWLRKYHPVICIWYWDGGRGVYNLSLRSDGGEVDVSAIAAKFGGGGHAAAAGFICKELPWRT